MWSEIKNQRVPIGLVVVLLAAVLWARDWQMGMFVTRAEAQEQYAEAQKQHAIFSGYALENRVRWAIFDADRYDQQLWELIRDEKATGETPASQQRIREVESRLKKAVAYRDCLLKNEPNCELLNKQ